MDIIKVVKFLLPEYQIIQAMIKDGFWRSKKSNNRRNIYNQYQQQYNNARFSNNSYQSVNQQLPNNSYQSVNQQFSTNFINKNNTNSGIASYNGKDTTKVLNKNIDDTFNYARKELDSIIIGQSNYINDLILSFKRPLVVGYNKLGIKNIVFVIGNNSCGRHTSIEAATKILKQNNLLNYQNISKIDLSLYPSVSEQMLFISDLYKSLYMNSDVVLFENFEKCHSSIINIISELGTSGKYTLESRYTFKDNILIDTNGALVPNTISEISANGKYLFFITESKKDKIIETFGSKFMSKVGDIILIQPYTADEIIAISEKLLQSFVLNCKNNLSIIIKFNNAFVNYCAKKYKSNIGIVGIKNYIDENIYKPLAEYKLRNSLSMNICIMLSISDNEIIGNILDQNNESIIYMSKLIPEKYNSNLEDIKKELNDIIGLSEVKEYVLNLENNLKIQEMRETSGYKAASISKHMIFTGNPGTGKTTIARIVTKYLKSIGALSTGQLREVSRSDLVGQYVGQTAKLTSDVIQSAIGGVLFIDEAYSLCRDKQDVFGLEAIDALVKGIEDNCDDLVVILAGYSNEMAEFLETNSGLKSRFPNIINFEDYTAEEMYQISLITAKSKGYKISDDCKEPLIRLFTKSQIRGKNDSGNGRLVRNIIESAILEQSKRMINDKDIQMDLLTSKDFNFKDFNKFDLEQSLSTIIGLENVKEFLRNQQKLIIASEKRRKAGFNVDTTQSLNMIFTGNPGTGKTTIARIVASMLKDMGLLKSGQLIETDKGGLVAEYVGQTAKKTEQVFRSALGGVLFIDEAYSLSSSTNSFGQEAIDTLVKLIEDFRGEIVVILAGYKKEMATFMESNSGLESRFPLIIDFPDYSVNELYEITLHMINKNGFEINDDGKLTLHEQIEDLHKHSTAQSGNGRMVRNLVEKIMRNQSSRIASNDIATSELTKILPCDIDVSENKTNNYDLEKSLVRIIGLSQVKSYIRSLSARLKIQQERNLDLLLIMHKHYI